MEIVPINLKNYDANSSLFHQPLISLRDQIQAANPSLRNLDKNNMKFLALFPYIYTTREIIPIAIWKGTIFIVAGTIMWK